MTDPMRSELDEAHAQTEAARNRADAALEQMAHLAGVTEAARKADDSRRGADDQRRLADDDRRGADDVRRAADDVRRAEK